MSEARTSPQAPGGGRIVALMVLFTIAIGFDVAAIAGLAAVGGWWMLAMAFGVHLFASAIVLVEVADVIAGRRRWHRQCSSCGSADRAGPHCGPARVEPLR